MGLLLLRTGAVISPNIMALKYAHWNEGYLWTAYVQIGILAVCILVSHIRFVKCFKIMIKHRI